MRRFLIPLGGLIVGAALGACKDSVGVGACFESGATQYPVHAPGDTSIVFNWPASFQPVRYYVEPTGNLPNHVLYGLTLWITSMRCNELTAQIVTDSTVADVIFRNPVSLPPALNAITVAADSVGACRGRTDILLDPTGTMVQRPIHAYVSPFITDSVAVEACYHFVTAHEIGHTLGLLSHSSDPNDLMYVTPHHTQVSINDLYTIELLYHLTAPIPPTPR